MRKKSSKSSRTRSPKNDMMEAFNMSPWHSVGKILPTTNEPKVDVFESYRPHRQCVDYNISEVWAKMQKGDLKVNVKQTVATYEDIPPELCTPRRKKKEHLFTGGPPQWTFVDEVWRKQVDEGQAKLLGEQKNILGKAKASRKNRLRNDHAQVQRLVGPEWFMELSPKQLAAIDQLNQAVFWDLTKGTTICCEEILAILGLVLRPSKSHINTALQHSCGCAVEFLLVLYQLMNPKRETYSLNDRLLLSSVVHLSIRPTLKELHVRIPSPPEEAEEPKPEKKKEKKKKFSSPYLEPLRYQPAPPRFTGIYTNKHKQYPENSYFSYINEIQEEKNGKCCAQCPPYRGNDDLKQRMKEYKQAQEFYETLPGVREQMLELIPPSIQNRCPNMLHPRNAPPINPKLIAPHLCKVTQSEPVLCFCEESCLKGTSTRKEIKRSGCEKSAQKFLGSLCLCDDCLEKVRQQNLIRIHGGFQKSPCKCDDPVPIIQGTLRSKVCECYKEYRNKIVGCAARQRLMDSRFKHVLGEVVMTRYGPVYNITGTKGPKICLCNEIIDRKAQLNKSKELLLKNEAKFVISGISMTPQGPVFNLTSVVARRPCKCILKYWQQLAVLTIQNKIRTHPIYFVNNGLVMNDKFGPIFHFSGVPCNQTAKPESDLRTVCSCEIRKTKCFERCMDYLDYKVASHQAESSANSEESSSSETSSSCSDDESSTDDAEDKVHACPYCSARSNGVEKKKPLSLEAKPTGACLRMPCRTLSSTVDESTTEGESSDSSEPSSDEETSSNEESSSTTCCSKKKKRSTAIESAHDDDDEDDDFFKPKPCKCKDELERFMKSKCPCEECNRKIRQSYARYVMGGTKATPSGNQVNIVQGIQQHMCGCMHEHLENTRKIEEYKSRVKARYHMRKQPKKYAISGVKNTPSGPVYIISGMRPPVECECGKAMREEEEEEAFEKQRAKPPNTGRIKYEISGVKAMPEENVYIMSRALNVKPCACSEVLQKFERVHKNCMDEFEKYMAQTNEETSAYVNEMRHSSAKRSTLRSVDRNFAQGFENYPSDVFLSHAFTHTPRHSSVEKEHLRGAQANKESREDWSPIDQVILCRSRSNNESAQDTEGDGDCKDHLEKFEKAGPMLHKDSGDAGDDETKEEEEESTSSDGDYSSSLESDSDSSDTGSCHVDNPPDATPITIPHTNMLPESFLSKRFALFRHMPKCQKTLKKTLKHILEGMAEDGFPLAKLPQVHKLPIFKLWIELRIGTYWSYEDRLRYHGISKYYWRHTDVCYRHPRRTHMPFSKEKADTLTWKHAKLIRKAAETQYDNYYRKVKQVTVDSAREFFATTFPYEFPTHTWRDCAFAYLPSKEEDLFPYKIVQPHETRTIPSNKKTNCYC